MTQPTATDLTEATAAAADAEVDVDFSSNLLLAADDADAPPVVVFERLAHSSTAASPEPALPPPPPAPEPSPPPPPGRIVLVPVDSSRFSENALDWAVVHLVRPATDLILLLHVRPDVPRIAAAAASRLSQAKIDASAIAFTRESTSSSSYYPRSPSAILRHNTTHPTLSAFRAQDSEISHQLLRAYGYKLPARYNVRGISVKGDPRLEILRLAKDVNADVIVVGSRGLGAFRSAMIG
ncbi:hypothetical protein HK405_010214, partial [Cladochytrium tenue]